MLAMRFGWHYWEAQSLPNDFISELLACIKANEELRAKETETGDILSRMRAANETSLKKLGLKK